MVFLTYVRAYLGLVFSVLQTAVVSVSVIFLASFGQLTLANRLIRMWARLWLIIFNVEVIIEKNEFAHGSQGALYIFNHQSFYDIFAIHSVLKNTARFGAKIELFRIPVLNLAMRASGALPIARDNRKEVFRVYAEAQKKFEEKWSFILAPEGTRQSEPHIGRFKKGPFIFAINAQVPLIPIVISGSYDVMPKNTLAINAGKWKRTIRMSFLAPVYTTGITVDKVSELTDRVRVMFVNEYERLEAIRRAAAITERPR
jgi:1-acyl-sn-glycerol-3-phosphate acyltransferase